MEVYKSKKELLRKKKFPKYKAKNGFADFFAYLLSVVIWIFVFIAGLIALYTYWFSRNLVYLVSFIDKKPYRFPFWMALLLVILVFPFTLAVILIGSLIKIFKQ